MAVAKLNGRDFRKRVVAGSFPQFSTLADALQELKFVQADPIRVPARAQDLLLRQRVAGYAAGDLEKNFESHLVEEGYLFAYGFMTPDIWHDVSSRPRRKLTKQERHMLDFVSEAGEVHPRTLDETFGRKLVKNYWGGKSRASKQVLDRLHYEGYLRVSRREKGMRVYQVSESIDQQNVDPAQRYLNLVKATAHVFGPTTQGFLISELRSHNHLVPARRDRLKSIESLVNSGELSRVEVKGVSYLWSEEKWSSQTIVDRVRILAPFDPLVRDRERFAQLWNWSYRFEAYVPAKKRERGYYAMPVLWNDHVIGWANVNTNHGCLKVELGYAGKRPGGKAFQQLVENEVELMANFLGLQSGAWELAL